MRARFCKVEEAVEAVSEGRPVIVVDAEDREDEGDFVVAAERITAEVIHFLITHGRGQLCMPVMPDVAVRLNLFPLPKTHDCDTSPCFTIPVDHRDCRTGISPEERAMTIRAITDLESEPSDFIYPGHVFPLVARPEGVLRRTGHTEAAIELARWAGCSAAGVLCEICSRDGRHMARQPELFDLATQFRLPIISIDELVEHAWKVHRDDATRAMTWEPPTSPTPLAFSG